VNDRTYIRLDRARTKVLFDVARNDRFQVFGNSLDPPQNNPFPPPLISTPLRS
jgi:hypothetical protein